MENKYEIVLAIVSAVIVILLLGSIGAQNTVNQDKQEQIDDLQDRLVVLESNPDRVEHNRDVNSVIAMVIELQNDKGRFDSNDLKDDIEDVEDDVDDILDCLEEFFDGNKTDFDDCFEDYFD